MPVEHPVVPTIPTRARLDTPTRGTDSRAKSKDGHHGLKLSVSGLLRRASGKGPSENPPSETGSKRRFIPRLFGRKPDLPQLRIVASHPNMRSPQPTPPPSSTSAALSPARSRAHVPTLHTPSDDAHLVSSKDIQDAILSLDSELRGLVDAFDNLEHSAVRRIKKQSARRLPANTPDSVDVLLEGREWREHRRIGPPRAPSTPAFNARYHVTLEPVSDGRSVHSGHSERTSISYASPISPTRSMHFRTQSSSGLQRQASVSSASSRSGSMLSSNRPGISVSMSDSSTNLPLYPARTLSSVTDDDELDDLEDEADQLSELHEIQQRRNEVVSRYNRRIEYLKAKHKGAELRERVSRK